MNKIERIYEVIASDMIEGCAECWHCSSDKKNKVMLGDVLQWWYEKSMTEKYGEGFIDNIGEFRRDNSESFKVVKELLKLWGNYRESIDNKSPELIEYIFNLVTKCEQ